MALSNLLNLVSATAGSDLTGKCYRFCKRSGGKVIPTTVAGERIFGVIQDELVLADQQTGVAIVGSFTKMVAGAAISDDADIMTDNAGRAVTATSGKFIVGRAMEAASAAGDIIQVYLCPGANVV